MGEAKSKKTKSFGKIGIFVMGDIGRSPRMMNHAIEFAQNIETAVEVIGQRETELPLFFACENIRIRTITSKYLKVIKSLPAFIYLFVRLMIETALLFYHFFIQIKPRYDYIVVQNPPGIPVLMVLFFYRFIFRTKIWVDVHNFGFTLYQTKNKILLSALKFIEINSIRFTADRVFVVSQNMSEHLTKEWKVIKPIVLYDKPNYRTFKKMSLKEKHVFFTQFSRFSTNSTESIIAKINQKGEMTEQETRPLLFVVSSSWSHDDYFELLIETVKKYSAKVENKRSLLFIMTGAGPLRTQYSRVFSGLNLPKIAFEMHWFKMSDYPKIIGSVDFGISLHNSTSGFDLPIKALDYMACEVPCLAFDYSKTIGELVKHGKNGMLFKNAEELVRIFELLDLKGKSLNWEFENGDWTNEWREKIY